MASFRSFAFRSAVAALLLGGATSALANVLVVRSLGNAARSYPPGRSLPDTATVNLAAGDTLVLLGARGTRTLRGPGTFRVSGPVQSNQMADLLRDRRPRARVGAVRAPRGVGGPSTDVWPIDSRRGGTYCIAEGATPGVWRSDAVAPGTVRLARAGSSGTALQWEAGQHVLQWPTAIAIEPGVEYVIAGAGRPAVMFRFVPIANLSAPQDLAAALIENGCHAQLDLLIDTTPEG